MAITMRRFTADGASSEVQSPTGAPDTSPATVLLWVDLSGEDIPDFEDTAAALGLREPQLEFLCGNRSRLPIPAASAESVAAVLHRVSTTIDEPNQVTRFRFSELRVLAAEGLVVTVQADEPGQAPLGMQALRESTRLAHPSVSVTSSHAIAGLIGAVLREYPVALDELENAIEAMEGVLFQEARLDAALSHRIYQLLQKVHRFDWAMRPLESVATERGAEAAESSAPGEESSTWTDLIMRTRRMRDRVELLRSHLENAVALHSTLLTIEQNDATRRLADASYAQGEQSKKISGWAAILFAPTLIASIYGMNFRHMPELSWAWGYPVAVALMVGLSLTLWTVFKRRHWL
ncbi:MULTISPECIES: CorA family divalent cation transporter [unclassified Nesterenkonia]|uniref:CorA family divalent cation transporter n=1 Tax=unclassified Nesterenkonia TaxID=2629769 RepID=UPI001F4C9773|nr:MULTISPECIES: CorA family divalent cation transporter [unclassified Nesterenkonia]MCH8560790.1 hypothetical protein [Nesterenkonia sp. DZ6]MCH8563601.1 hypothetical protein [Nesterenkonia sp. YGD6]MCH8570870.1 hypothetical protein [Nesterenkonia sp. AY15]